MPDGSVATRWIDGAKPEVKLDAPKGVALSGGTLWVADITVVRKFDAKTGEPKGEVKIHGAKFLNDVTPDGEDGVYVTDTGIDEKFQPAGADAIYRITKDDEVKPVIKSKNLGGPNGIVLANGSLWVATFASGEVYEVKLDGKQQKGQKLPAGQLDCIVALEGGELIVSSWAGKTAFRGKPGGEWKDLALATEAPADIGWDAKRKRLLIPRFQDNALTILALE